MVKLNRKYVLKEYIHISEFHDSLFVFVFVRALQ